MAYLWFFDIELTGWGQNWVRALDRALEECERTSSIGDGPAGLKRKVRPLMPRRCRDLSTFPRFLRWVQDIDVSAIACFEAKGLGQLEGSAGHSAKSGMRW